MSFELSRTKRNLLLAASIVGATMVSSYCSPPHHTEDIPDMEAPYPEATLPLQSTPNSIYTLDK